MARERHADTVAVPDVVGMTVEQARAVASAAGVHLAQPDPDGPPLGALTWRRAYVVTDQEPQPGALLFRWDSLAVSFAVAPGGGPAPVREPRRPGPDPGALAASRTPPPARTAPDRPSPRPAAAALPDSPSTPVS